MGKLMMRKMMLGVGVGALLMFGGANTALAADSPPSAVPITYTAGSGPSVLMLDANLSDAERAEITEYDIRVDIQGQPTRKLTVSSLPATLFNVLPGTKVHAYLVLKGKTFGTSPEYDGGLYTQGFTSPSASPSTGPSRTPVPSASNTPSASPSTTQPTGTSSPSASSSPGITEPGTKTTDGVDPLLFISDHITGVTLVGTATFLGCCVGAILRRRRRA